MPGLLEYIAIQNNHIREQNKTVIVYSRSKTPSSTSTLDLRLRRKRVIIERRKLGENDRFKADDFDSFCIWFEPLESLRRRKSSFLQ